MSTIRHKFHILAAALALFGSSAALEAASTTTDFITNGTANYIFLFADDPNDTAPLSFTSLDFRADFAGWNIDALRPALAIFSGPAVVAGAGTFTLGFDYSQRSVSFQWAEVMFNSGVASIETTGSALFRANRRGPGGSWSTGSAFAHDVFVNNYFSSIPAASVPLPSPLLLMLSAAALMGFSRRRSDAEVTP